VAIGLAVGFHAFKNGLSVVQGVQTESVVHGPVRFDTALAPLVVRENRVKGVVGYVLTKSNVLKINGFDARLVGTLDVHGA
jgi:hypothetical protein